jgi:tetratricopeptide (TPR) repeat protein
LEKELNARRVTRDTDKLVQLATLFRQAREYGRAIPVLEAATQSGGSGAVYAQLGEALYNEGLCVRAEKAFKKAIDRGYEAGIAWTLIATCRYEDVQKQEKLTCAMSPAEKADAPKTKARQSAIAAFENVPPGSKDYRAAKKWVSFIKSERLTFDKRCEFEERVRREECFKDIRRAYDGQFVDGKFTLGNPECEEYLEAYDKEYRVKEAG